MPSPKRISDIKNTISRVAQSSHYEVNFSGFPYKLNNAFSSHSLYKNFISRNLGLLCYDATLPGSSLATTTIEGNFTGVQQQYAHTRIFNNISLGFYCDSDYQVLKFFEAWIEFISGGGTADKRQRGYFYRMRYPDQYKCEGLRISKFDRDYRNGVQYNFISAFPVSISGTPVSYEASNSILRISVDFNFDRYVMSHLGSGSGGYPTSSGSSSGSSQPTLSDLFNFSNTFSSNNNNGSYQYNSSLEGYFTSDSTANTNQLNQALLDNWINGKGLSWDPSAVATSDKLNFVARS